MTEEQAKAISQKIVNCMDAGQLAAFSKMLDALQNEPAKNVCLCLGQAFIMGYTSFKADSYAKYLEIALRHSPEWGEFGGVNNPLFRASFLVGSMDMYECFIQEVPGLNEDFFVEAYGDFTNMQEQIMDTYHTIVCGQEYNRGIPRGEFVQIEQGDYRVVIRGVEAYNAIINRRKILKDVEKRM